MDAPREQVDTNTREPLPSEIDDTCPRCGRAELGGRHCKLVCPGCGYAESCEDIFPTARYRRDDGQHAE